MLAPGFLSRFQFHYLTESLCCSHVVSETCHSMTCTQLCTLEETDGRTLVKIRQYLFFCLKVCDSHNTNESQKHYLNNRSQIQTCANGMAISGLCAAGYFGVMVLPHHRTAAQGSMQAGHTVEVKLEPSSRRCAGR